MKQPFTRVPSGPTRIRENSDDSHRALAPTWHPTRGGEYPQRLHSLASSVIADAILHDNFVAPASGLTRIASRFSDGLVD